jgi:predicted TIM-barrel fold metal-dependent hydrolase
MGADIEMGGVAWRSMTDLAQSGAWVKLSGWYRLGAQAPYASLLETMRRIVDLFGPRVVWGSDWPHTAFVAHDAPPYASTWQPVLEGLGAPAASSLRNRLPAIYR